MNLLQLKIGYDETSSEFFFHTKRPQSDFYDEHYHITPWFMDWLSENIPCVSVELKGGMEYEINYYSEKSIDVI